MQHLCLNTTQHQHVQLTHKVNNVQTLKIEDGTSGPFENLLNQEGCVLCTAQCTVCSALTNYGMLTKCTCKKRNTGVTNYLVPEMNSTHVTN